MGSLSGCPFLFYIITVRTLFYTNPDIIRTKMNEYGKCKLPFLFGVNYEMTEGFFIGNPLGQQDICFQMNGIGNKKVYEIPYSEVDFDSYPISYKEYKGKFDIIYNGLHRGYSFLSNLTVKTPIETNLSLEDIFALNRAPYQLYIPQKFVCFSPERFVKIENGLISSNPMKGTIDAYIPNAEEVILNDFKETAEHNTIVDLIRNDLSIVASNVRVERFRYIDRIKAHGKEILQVSSEITGDLDRDYSNKLGDILFSLLPAGSICGAPKAAIVGLIHSAEKEPRGYYTGVFGYYDGEKLDSAVFIRFIESDKGQMYFRSGGGITAYSKCEDEYKEVLDKIYLPFV